MGKNKLIPTVKGTRDFYPEQMEIRTWLYRKVGEVARSFGYQEYEGPFLESIDLYAAKSGEELVKEQSFVFPDRGGNLITLRPELTPTLARMVAQKQGQLAFPIRWWSFGPFWRYERPQKGRTREFFQWNLDLLGSSFAIADAEIINVIASFFQSVGLSSDEVVIYVNNRALMDKQLSELGINENRKQIYRVIDRKEKLSHESWVAYAGEMGLSAGQIRALEALLDNKQLWKESDELPQIFELLDTMGVADFVAYDPEIIRGLDYYTGTVYEAKSRDKQFRRSILGGGRYDNLLADVGGNPLPGAGFAMGDVVITLLLEQLGKLPGDVGLSPAKILVTVFDEDCQKQSLLVAKTLRGHGLNTVVYPAIAKLGKQFRYADRIGAKIVLVVGPDEVRDRTVTVKNLEDGTQQTIREDALAKTVKKLLESQVLS